MRWLILLLSMFLSGCYTTDLGTTTILDRFEKTYTEEEYKEYLKQREYRDGIRERRANEPRA